MNNHHPNTTEKDAGLEARYHVRKINDPTGKHDDCRYFVLDPQHDPLAVVALLAYERAAREAGFHALADDLYEWRRTRVTPNPECYDDHGDSRTRIPHRHVSLPPRPVPPTHTTTTEDQP